MHIILAMVTSVDGKSTKDTLSPREWSSKEDKEYLFKLIKKQKLIVMGRKTYEDSKSMIKLSSKILRIVITKNPKKYQKQIVAEQLEFSDDTPLSLVQSLKDLGYKQMLLLGGSDLNNSFFKAKLINELWLTIEPKIFGKGNGIVSDSKHDIKLKLRKVEKLNKQGTLLLKYNVI